MHRNEHSVGLHQKSRLYKSGRDVQKVSGSPGGLGGAGFLRLPRLRDRAQLLHHAQHILLAPQLHNLTVGNAKYVNACYCHSLAGRGNAHELALVGTAERKA